MTQAMIPENEQERLSALYSYDLLDQDVDAVFDTIIQTAADICDVEISVIALIDRDRQYFLARNGMKPRETPRAIAFCAHAILEPGKTFEIPDATKDARFADNPLVTGEIGVRFYAAQPLTNQEGYAIGGLCLIGKEPKTLNDIQRQTLKDLGSVVMALIETRKSIIAHTNSLKEVEAHLILEVEKAEATLAELTSHKIALDEHAIVAVTDTAGTITYVNEKFCQISGYSRKELIGQNHRILNSGHHPKSFFARMFRTIASGKPWHGEIKNHAKDGSYYWVDTTISPFRDASGKITHYVAIRTDITGNRRAMEEIEEQRNEMMIKNAELEAYDHTIAHSLKTPLSASIRFLHILSDFESDNLSEEQLHLVKLAQKTLVKTGDIVDALLLLSTVSSQQVEHKPIAMTRLVKEALRQLEKESLSAQATVKIPGKLLTAVGHAPWVGEVWLNYLSNAFKYCELPVKLELGSSKEGDGFIRYWVKDNGKPLTQEEQEKLFVPFSRLHHEGIDGHGLGLTIVQRVVRKHGGIVGVDTPDSGGNRFFFTLPAVRDMPNK